jgi:hypothetical protein
MYARCTLHKNVQEFAVSLRVQELKSLCKSLVGNELVTLSLAVAIGRSRACAPWHLACIE